MSLQKKNKTTKTEKETFDFAKSFAKKLKGGEVIGLIGELGAGKTIFTKGLAKGLGIKNNIQSPTFVIMKIYQITNPKLPIKQLVHIDAYRLKTERDLEAIGATEYLNDTKTVVVIEWADRIKKILPKNTILINIKIKGDKRIINYIKYERRKTANTKR